MYNEKERTEYNIYRDRVCEKLGITVNQYNAIRRIGQVLHLVYEQECNGDINDTYYNNETTRLYDNAGKLVDTLKLYVFYQTDPRGATIYLDKQPIPTNNYTSASCIY